MPKSPLSLKSLAAAFLLLALVPGAYAQQIDQLAESLAVQIVDSLKAENKKKVAIVELTDLSGCITPLGQLVAEELTGQLFKAQGLTLVERSKLDEVLGEQRLGVRGLLEKRNVETVGKALGVEAILTGTIAVFEDRVRVNARVIAVPSAELFATSAGYMSKLGLASSYFEATDCGEDNGPTGSTSPVAVQERQSIRYELLGCTQATRIIECRLVLTNNGADRSYRINLTNSGGTYLFDQRGHSFKASRIKLADLEITRGYGDRRLIAEIPVETKLIFEGVPSSIDFIKVLHIGTGDGDVEFRDIRFSK